MSDEPTNVAVGTSVSTEAPTGDERAARGAEREGLLDDAAREEQGA